MLHFPNFDKPCQLFESRLIFNGCCTFQILASRVSCSRAASYLFSRMQCKHHVRKVFTYRNSDLCSYGNQPCTQEELAWFITGCLIADGVWCSECVQSGSQKHIKKANNKTTHGCWRHPCLHCSALTKAHVYDDQNASWVECDLSTIDKSHVELLPLPMAALCDQAPAPAPPPHVHPVQPPGLDVNDQDVIPPPPPPALIDQILRRLEAVELHQNSCISLGRRQRARAAQLDHLRLTVLHLQNEMRQVLAYMSAGGLAEPLKLNGFNSCNIEEAAVGFQDGDTMSEVSDSSFKMLDDLTVAKQEPGNTCVNEDGDRTPRALPQSWTWSA